MPNPKATSASSAVILDGRTLSDYELLRERKIARNEARLQSLGLSSGPMLSSVSISKPSAADKAPRKRKPKRPPREGTRKSLRKLGATPHYNLEESAARLDEYDPEAGEGGGVGKPGLKRKGSAKKSNNGGSALSAPVMELSGGVPGASSGGAVKASDLRIDLSKLSPHLNSLAPATGKAAVIDLLASTVGRRGSSLSWSKYSGSLLFKNAAILWMNFDKNGGGDYVNDFGEGGEEVNWYGGSKVSSESNMYKGLRQRFSFSSKADSGVVVFARFCEGSKSEPYVYLGRVELVETG
eukprot:CAMPEP_0182454284 /NCGR_PEP_ID=MMETSP1319-20130603/987_1 /TAXON_ID=172717 /ORGANISM="Bolidomonas pacifica, Strain RCC208" /LENGTH=295 /DNA_ID=CAMNT_0024652285 /DNA_START=107 /DNA_END=990 /DNA_ORIENTATION=+